MNIQVPWKMRMRSENQVTFNDSNWWVRKKFHDDLNVAKRPSLVVEDDLDHLGALHKHSH